MKILDRFHARFEIFNAVLIAIVSLSTAFTVWRTSVIGSNAADQTRQGLIDAVKRQAFLNENYRKMYEEAGYAYQFSAEQAEVQALEASKDPVLHDRGANVRQYLLPNMQLLADPLATDEKYKTAQGAYDLKLRFEDLQTSEVRQLDPSASFERADSFYAEQRWLVVGSILLTISLFFLALAEISGKRMRALEFIAGLGVYLVGMAWFFGVEALFFLAQ